MTVGVDVTVSRHVHATPSQGLLSTGEYHKLALIHKPAYADKHLLWLIKNDHNEK